MLLAATVSVAGVVCVRADVQTNLGVTGSGGGAGIPGAGGSVGGRGGADSGGIGGTAGSGGGGAGGGSSGGSSGGMTGSGGDGVGGSAGSGSGGDTGLGGSGELDAGVFVPPTVAGQLVITEIMADTTVAKDDLGEWLEVYNPGVFDKFDLFGCTLFDSAGTDVIGRHVIVPPTGFVTFARSIDPTVGFIPTYDYPTVKMSNTGDQIGLSCGGVTIDRVVFTTWPVPKGRSFSLDKNHYDAVANDNPANWCPGSILYNSASFDGAVESDYGTPGDNNPVCP